MRLCSPHEEPGFQQRFKNFLQEIARTRVADVRLDFLAASGGSFAKGENLGIVRAHGLRDCPFRAKQIVEGDFEEIWGIAQSGELGPQIFVDAIDFLETAAAFLHEAHDLETAADYLVPPYGGSVM